MPNNIRDDLHVVDETSFPYVYEENITINARSVDAIVRANVYRPKTKEKVPVLVTYGPYGKDIPYKEYVQHAQILDPSAPSCIKLLLIMAQLLRKVLE